MNTLLRFDTTDVFNQSPPYENVDLYASDLPLQQAVEANGAGHGGDVRARAPRQRESAEALHLRAFAATSSSFIRPTTS